MKKGFTLVEMALVIIIIGILLFLAIKGKILIESAKDRNEVAKIRSIENAVSVYSLQNGSLWYGNEFLTPEDLVNKGLLDEKDIYSNFRSSWGKNYFIYRFLNYDVVTRVSQVTNSYMPSIIKTGNIAVGSLQTVYNENGAKIMTQGGIPSHRAICVIEKFIDGATDDSEDNFMQGRGRAIYLRPSLTMRELLTPSCHLAEKVTYISSRNYAYALEIQ